MSKLFKSLILAGMFAFIITACGKSIIRAQSFGQSMAYPMLDPGDTIGSMIVTTGVDESVPLWAFCLPTVESDRLITVECREMSFPELAIGHTFGVVELVPKSFDWSELMWEMYLDEQPINLSAFGTYDFVHPDIAFSPSPIREVFRKLTVWDVVLVNPALGAHTLRGLARTEAETYTWIVNFTIEAPDTK